MANQKQRERQAAAKAWVCRFCWSDRTGERWWNADSASACKLCKRPKGSCFHSVKGAGGPPSVSVKEKAKAEELRSEAKRLKAELAEANKAAAAPAKAPADVPSMEVDEGDADKDAARIVELRDQIDGLEKLPDSSGAIAALRTAAIKELSECRARQLNAKPLPIQIQRVSQQIAVVEKRKAAKQKHLDGLDQQIAELQQQRLEAAKGLAAIQVELVDLEAQRTKVAANFPQPSTVVDGAQASLDSVLPSVRMSTAQLEQVATSFGADAGLARELSSVVGRVREAAIKAQADAEAEAARRRAEAAAPAAVPAPAAGGGQHGGPPPGAGAGGAEAAAPEASSGWIPTGVDDPKVLKAFLEAMGMGVPEDEEDLRTTAKRLGEGLSSFAKRPRTIA